MGREVGVIPDMDDMEHMLLRVKADTKPEKSLDSESVPCVTLSLQFAFLVFLFDY